MKNVKSIRDSNIRHCIYKHAYPNALNKGISLYESNRIRDMNFDRKKDEAHCKVVETDGNYVVKIKEISGRISTQCTCPYEWGELCKHTVAALLYLDEALVNPAIPVNQSLRNSSDNIEIEYLDEIQPELWNTYDLGSRERYWGNSNQFTMREFSEEGVSFEMRFHDYRYNEQIFRVEFHFSEGKLFTTCSCGKQVVALCTHQMRTLEHIACELATPAFFRELHPETLLKQKTALMEEFEFPDMAALHRYYKVHLLDSGHVRMWATKEGEGLLQLSDGGNEWLESFSSVLSRSGIRASSLPAYARIGNQGDIQLQPALMFEFNSFESKDKLNASLHIVPFAGKPNKAGDRLTTHLCQLGDLKSDTYVSLSGHDEQVIDLCSLLDNAYSDFGEPEGGAENGLEKQKKIFKKLQTLWPLLQKYKYIYRRSHADTVRNYYSENRLRKKDLEPVGISQEPLRITFEVSQDGLFIGIRMLLKAGMKEIRRASYLHFLVLLHEETLYLFNSFREAIDLNNFSRYPEIKVAKANFDDLFDKMIKPLAEKYPIHFNKLKGIKVTKRKLKPLEKRMYLSEVGEFITFNPVVVYEGEIHSDALNHGDILKKDGGTITRLEKDTAFERSFIEVFKALHPRFLNQFRDDFFHLPAKELMKNMVFIDLCDKMVKENIAIYGVSMLKSIRYSPHRAAISVSLKSGEDWFDVKINVAFGDQQASLKEVRRAVVNNERYVKLGDGKMGILPDEWLAKFKSYFLHGQVKDDELKVSKRNFNMVDELFQEEIDDEAIRKEIQEKKDKLKAFTNIKNVRKPKGVKAVLRDYQKEGFKWLCFLDEFKWGGILADDMGLGKTVQVLAFLCSKKNKSKEANLVVMPTTLLFNWKTEIEKFTPSLNVHVHHGSQRTTDPKKLKKYDLVLTTYGTMTNDIELLKEYQFNYVVLDESQAIKNPAAKRYKAACILRAGNRLALTGTPIENSTFDLYAQMNFANPGFLGTMAHFKEDFAKAIDQDKDPEKAAVLQRMINPFVLRRTKEQVVRELPPKTEGYLYCIMDKEQRKVYEAYRNKYRDWLLKKIAEDGLAKSKIHVLEGLTKLRQICDSPALLADKENYGNDSVKIRELMRNISEKTSNHKILVFSQFVQMLKLIEKELAKSGQKHVYLDGQTPVRERQERVERFQNDTECRVFLISLKAGGQGINLTAADYVFIVDPWWNPAVENQAIDRCYRIGQDKKVFAYRMICENTIEEKIIKHQERKKKLASDIIQTEDSFMKQITKGDIEKLFEE